MTGVDPGLSKMLRLKWKIGTDASVESLGAHGALVPESYANSRHLSVGSPIRLETPGGKYLDLRVKAIFSPPKGGSPLGAVTTSSATFDSVYPNPQNLYSFALVPGGVTTANTQRLQAALSSFPDA